MDTMGVDFILFYYHAFSQQAPLCAYFIRTHLKYENAGVDFILFYYHNTPSQ